MDFTGLVDFEVSAIRAAEIYLQASVCSNVLVHCKIGERWTYQESPTRALRLQTLRLIVLSPSQEVTPPRGEAQSSEVVTILIKEVQMLCTQLAAVSTQNITRVQGVY